MTTSDTLERGRESFRRHVWADAYARLSAADRENRLEPEDVELLATAAYLTGRDSESTDLWARAHQEHLTRGDRQRAAWSALWLAFEMFVRGAMAPTGGWLSRAERLLDQEPGESAAHGFLRALAGTQTMFAGDLPTAYATLSRAVEIGERFRDPNAVALGRLGQGECRIRQGEAAEGIKLLDEVMVAVTAGEVSPILTGLIYCGVIGACHGAFDFRRAQEWTAALTRWCESQPGLVAYRGVCLVHRAEIMQLRGAWPSAVDEARQACERLSQPPGHSSLGTAFYVGGELHRLQGEFAEAEEAYREASQRGRKPDPGLALLRLAQGQIDAAASAIRRIVEEAQDRRVRSRVLPAYVEIMLAAGDVPAARKGADELATIAAALGAPFMRAVAAQANGAVLLAEGDARAALTALHEAGRGWAELQVPYEAARVHVLVGLACRRLGDEETARMELDAARRTFQDLGAVPDAARAEELSRSATVSTGTRRTPGKASVTLGPGSRLGPYEIVASVGAGGMGQVFRARDTRLGRDVAVKILPPAFADDPESIRRFEKEARAVAALSHPNVVPLFDVGEQDGVRFAVAEFVAGETLRERLAGGPLPAAEAAQLAAQIAEGLAAAHEKGFVHRDIKPENVVLSRPGFPRILDFGLAKRNLGMAGGAVSENDVTQSALLTTPGVISGTVGYMSPEQVRGESVDGRSDVFSLGVVLWEMLTGRRPFRGESPVETLNAILKEEPPSDPSLTGLPPEFERIVRRCLEKRRENRYHSAADLAHDLRSAVAGAAVTVTRPLEPRRPRLGRAALALAAVLVLGAAVAAILLPRGRRSATGTPALPRTLAVLPFRAISAEGVPQKFGLGLADSLIGHLASVRELTVRPTSAIARYETAPAAAADVGRTLDVDAVVEGTYQKLGGKTRVSVQMTDVSQGSIIWSERIDLAEGQLFELQDTISRRVVEKLRVELDPAAMRPASGETARIPDRVMEGYLAARAGLVEVRLGDAPSRRRIADSFDPVLAEQPNFAAALGARAYARASLDFNEPTPDKYRAALSDAERAVALDPDLAEPRVARAALAWSLPGGWDVVKAVRELKQLVSKSPSLDIAHFDLALIYGHSGWFPEAEAENRALERIFPSDVRAGFGRVDEYFFGGNCPRTLEMVRALPEKTQGAWWIRKVTASCLAALHDPRRAEPEVDRLLRDSPDQETYFAIQALLRARSGRDFEDLEREALAGKERVGHFHHVQHSLAQAHAVAGDVRGAVEYLRQASENGFPCVPCFDNDPLLAPVRGSPEYPALRKEIERRDAGYRAALKDVL